MLYGAKSFRAPTLGSTIPRACGESVRPTTNITLFPPTLIYPMPDIALPASNQAENNKSTIIFGERADSRNSNIVMLLLETRVARLVNGTAAVVLGLVVPLTVVALVGVVTFP